MKTLRNDIGDLATTPTTHYVASYTNGSGRRASTHPMGLFETSATIRRDVGGIPEGDFSWDGYDVKMIRISPMRAAAAALGVSYDGI